MSKKRIPWQARNAMTLRIKTFDESIVSIEGRSVLVRAVEVREDEIECVEAGSGMELLDHRQRRFCVHPVRFWEGRVATVTKSPKEKGGEAGKSVAA